MACSDKFDRTIPLNCPTCGGTEFEYQSENDDTQPVKCPGCGLTTTKAELIASNSENIGAHMDEIKEQLLKDVTQSFKDAFKGNKYITIK
jgi:predicted  nucleic acid-binding Zn-ribbon protein